MVRLTPLGPSPASRPHRMRLARSEDHIGKNLVHTAPTEIPDEPLETARHRRQIGVVAQSRAQSNVVDARLRGVDLPRMKIEDAGPGLARIDGAQVMPRQPIRQQSEVAAAGAGKILSPEAARR